MSGLRQMGHDPAPVVAAVGLDEKTLSDPDGRVPVSLASAFFARAVRETGDANVGLHLAENAELSSFHSFLRSAVANGTRASPTTLGSNGEGVLIPSSSRLVSV